MVPVQRAVGRKRALEMLLTGEMVDARTALDWGLLNRVVPAGELESEVVALAEQIAAASAYVVALGKRAFYAQDALPEDAAYALASAVMVDNALADDAHEGMRAFLEKRAAVWPSR
jgi:enoyl-CoA hydratase/carnithine racemase